MLVRGADDASDPGEHAADPVEHLLPLDRVAVHDLPLLRVERAVLVDDLLRHGDLADVMEEGGELDVAPLAQVEAELVGDPERQLDDPAAVAAGVGVVGLDHVAEQQGRALVRLAQRQRLVDARLALVREHREHRGEWDHQHGHDRPDRDRRDRREQADRSEGAVEPVDRRHQAQALPRRGAVDEFRAQRRRRIVEAELGEKSDDVDRPVVPGKDLGAGDDQHQRGPDRVPAIAEDVEGAVDAGIARGVVEQPPQHPADADDQRHHRRRQQEEHRNQHQLGRHRVAVGDLELGPAGDHVGDDQEEERLGFQSARRVEEEGHRQGDDEEGDRHAHLDHALAAVRTQPRPRAAGGEKLFQLRCLGGGCHWRRPAPAWLRLSIGAPAATA